MENDYVIIGDIAFVKTKNKCIFMIDKEDIPKIQLPSGSYWFENVDGYIQANKPYTLLHRKIMNPDKNLVVDHINFIKNDNRKKNLRVVTKSQNSKHKPQNMKKKTKTDFKIVSTTLPKILLDRVDAYKKKKGFGTRTQTIFHLLQIALEQSDNRDSK